MSLLAESTIISGTTLLYAVVVGGYVFFIYKIILPHITKYLEAHSNNIEQSAKACSEYFNTNAIKSAKWMLSGEKWLGKITKSLFHLASFSAVVGIAFVVVILLLNPETWLSSNTPDMEKCKEVQEKIWPVVKNTTKISLAFFVLGSIFYLIFRFICQLSTWLHSSLKEAAGKIELKK